MNDTNNKKISYEVRKLVCNLLFFFCATESAIGSTDGDRFLEWQSRENARTFRSANPLTTLQDAIGRSMQIDRGDVIDTGGLGVVRSGTITGYGGETYEIVIKTPRGENDKKWLQNEGRVGDDLARAYANASGTSLLNKQGLPLVVLPVLAGEEILQNRVNGMNLERALNNKKEFFANGFVIDPQEAIELVAGLVLALHGMHQSGKIHRDMKLGNVMLEKQKIPPKIKARAMEIVARAMGLEGELSVMDELVLLELWEDLGLAVQEELKTLAEASLLNEEKYQYIYRIIDLGIAVDLECVEKDDIICSPNAAPEVVECIRTRRSLTAKPSCDMYALGTMFPCLFFGYVGMMSRNVGQGEMNFRGRLCSCTEDSSFVERVKRSRWSMESFILRSFTTLNEEMQECTGKSYSPDEVRAIAQVTADCLSLDPNDRPTALEVYKRLTKLLGRRDHRDGYRVEKLTAKQKRGLGLTPEELGAPDLTPRRLDEISRLRRERERELQDKARLRRGHGQGLQNEAGPRRERGPELQNEAGLRREREQELQNQARLWSWRYEALPLQEAFGVRGRRRLAYRRGVQRQEAFDVSPTAYSQEEQRQEAFDVSPTAYGNYRPAETPQYRETPDSTFEEFTLKQHEIPEVDYFGDPLPGPDYDLGNGLSMWL